MIQQKKIGIIGCGKVVPQAILNPIEEIEELQVYGISSRSREKAEKYAKEYAIPHVFESYDHLLASDEIDLVYIALSNHLHYEWTIKAIKAKKHVLVEKPLCLSYAEYQNIQKAFENSDQQVLEGIMVQHHPWQQAILNIINEQQYGCLKRVETKICIKQKEDLVNSYRSLPENGGGSFLDLSCYWLQFIQTVFGLDPLSYDGESSFNGPNGCDMTFKANMTFKSGEAQFICSYEMPYKVEHILYFEHAKVRVADFFRAILGHYKINLYIEDFRTHRKEKLSFDPQCYYSNQLKFLSKVICGKASNIPLDYSGERIKMMENIYKKARDRLKASGG